MISSATLDFTSAFISIALLLFFGIGAIYTTLAVIIHAINKIVKPFRYYFLSFILSGIIGLSVVVVIAFAILTS